ncbi:MAG: PAS domain S-box protein [Desulfobulbaceae bacterium]|nr:PAS domain S-box protein [Desulfobulbaceae bacterium]
MAKPNTNSQRLLNSLSISEGIGSCSRLSATLTDLIDVMDIAMWELDRDYKVVGFNRKAKEIYGASSLGKFCYQAAAKLDTICDDCPAKKVFEGHASGRSERKRTRISGEIIYIDHIATPIRTDKDGPITGVMVVIIDITQHKMQEQELIAHRNGFEQTVLERTRDLEKSQDLYRQLYEESSKGQELYRSLLNSAADAIAIYDLQGCVQYLNPCFYNTFGWQVEELKGKPLLCYADGNSETSSVEFRGLLETGQAIRNFLTKRPTKDGRLLDVSISAAQYADHRGEPTGIICSFRDVTEAKAMEMQFYRAQKFEALGAMAGGLAHDFNNVLMGIQGSASLMELDAQLSKKNIEKLKNIEKFVKQGQNLTRQLLALARGDQREVKPLDLNALLTSCANMFGQTRREILIHRSLQSRVWPVEADAGQIEQVLLNLFVNAAHAMPGGGDLFLETENVRFDQQHCPGLSAELPSRYVKITVIDSGCGIDPQILDKIFDPFFTTKGTDRGTGLGLASAYGIINNHGGFIKAGNSPRGGAEFSLFLPASDKTVLQERTLPVAFLQGSETILLVDDEEMVLELTGEMLQRLGYTILRAPSGVEALKLFHEHRSRISLAILDMVMPGMGGAELFHRLKEVDTTIKVLLSTGYSLSDQAVEILNQGCHGFIQKPFTLLEISQKVREILD